MTRGLHGSPTQAVLLSAAVGAGMFGAGTVAAETRPGTPIANTASVAYETDGTVRRTQSNTVTILVAERLDVALTRTDDTMPQIVDAPVAVPLVLTNSGNGDEAFTMAATASTTTASVDGIAVDRDANGRFDAGTDRMLTGATPVLAPGETLRLVAVIAPADGMPPDTGAVKISAEAVTGSGAADALFAGAGDGGADAVTGTTGGVASTDVPFQGLDPAAPRLIKRQSILAPDGSSDAVSGAVVTYTLIARFPATPTRAARIDDPIPAGVAYLPGSLTLDGAALTDADDADRGAVRDRAVAIALGDIPTTTLRTVTFKVRLP